MNRTRSIFSFVAAALAVASLSACSATSPVPVPGAVEAQMAPSTNANNARMWDGEAKAFGPVPAAKQAEGDRACAQKGYGKATGYHSKATDAKGKPFAGGGYVCATA